MQLYMPHVKILNFKKPKQQMPTILTTKNCDISENFAASLTPTDPQLYCMLIIKIVASAVQLAVAIF